MRRLSAVIPVHNPSGYLEKVLAALRTQSYRIDELIVTDDGSEDDVLGLLKGQLGRLPFPLTYVHQPRRGSRRARCRNNGIRAARGDFLLFCDQDIVFGPRYVETFARQAEAGRFLVAYPVRLSEAQSRQVTVDLIESGHAESVVTTAQRRKIRSQYLKDSWSYFLRRTLPLHGHTPKLRSGVFAIHRSDLEQVNGFDETYEGWGNEDDDLGRRLYRAGVLGRNVFRTVFPLHLHHPTSELRADRVNREYYLRRTAEIAAGEISPARGLRDPRDEGEISVTRLT